MPDRFQNIETAIPQKLDGPTNFLRHCLRPMLDFSRNSDFELSQPLKVFGLHFSNTHVFSLGASFNALR